MAVQDYKINYKSDFVLNINGDAGWAVPFCIKFWTGMPSQAYFVGFDGVKYVNCRVGDTPTQLLVMFDDHHLPIGKLMMQIAYHTTIEEFPGSVFDEVTNARDVIVTIDGTDYQVLLDFTGEDAPELEFDLPAYANEAERIQNELQRQQNEAARIAAELQREQATAAAVQGAENVNAQLNGYVLTVTNRQGVSTSVNTKGEQGEQGPVGPEGPQGEQGVSIVSFLPKSETSTTLIYTITYSNGYTQDVAIPKGPKGDTGATGPTGPQGPQGDTGVSITGFIETGETETATLYNITFSNGTTQAVAIPKGEKGDQGPVGPQGPQGPMGDVAVITPEQQAAFTMYSTTGQNTNGPMTQKAVTDSLVGSAISYDNSQSGLAAENVQVALDVLGELYVDNYSSIDIPRLPSFNYFIQRQTGYWNRNDTAKHKLIAVNVGEKYYIEAKSNVVCQYAFLTSATVTPNKTAPFVTGTSVVVVAAGSSDLFTIPSGCLFLYVLDKDGASNDYSPQLLKKERSVEHDIIAGSDSFAECGGVRDAIDDIADMSYDKQLLTSTESSSGKRLNQDGTTATIADTFYHVNEYAVNEKTLYIIQGRVYGSASACMFVFYDELDNVLSYGVKGSVYGGYNHISVIKSPTGAVKLKVQGDDAVGSPLFYSPAYVYRVKREKTIYPKLIYGSLGSADGGYMYGSPSKGALITPRFIKIKGDVVINVPYTNTCTLRVCKFADDYSYVGYNDTSITGGGNVTISSEGVRFIKFDLRVSSALAPLPIVRVSVTGDFDDDWDIFNIRPSDSGYYRIPVCVNVTDPTCCDAITSDNTIKDSQELLIDYGVIALPIQYSNTGEPTRLIIHCHGAGVNYSTSVTRFNNDDLEPSYWLAEGYAVMDIEGNPFNNENAHVYTPQTMDSYIAGYEWAIEHYNLKRDGVFVGGRSMGGANVFNLISGQCPIPVIAACANVPSVGCMGSANAANKSYFAVHCGFDVPSGFSWSNTYTSQEKQIFLANWDKLIKNNPIIRMTVDLPVTDEFKQQFVDCYVTESTTRVDLWKVLHMVSKCPVKLFGCNQDPSSPPQYTSQLLYKMLINAAQIVELRLFNSSQTGYNAHHYEIKDSALRTNVVTRYGVELENVPVPYIEMLQFWRRYEQRN